MERTNSHPLVSLIIAFYNQEKFAKDAIEGALSQDYDNLEIIFSDDCSTDNTFNVIQETIRSYTGPHKIIVNRNEPNLGISKHFNKLIYELSSGTYIAAAGGDDVSMPTRISESVEFLEKNPKVQSVTFKSQQVDVHLKPIGICQDLSLNEYSIYSLEDYCKFKDFIIYSGDSRTFRRELVDSFPPLKEGIEEDLEFFVRSFLCGQVAYIRKPLVKRRNHGENVSSRAQSRKQRNMQIGQLLDDVNYAFNSQMISEQQYKAMVQKIKTIESFFYDNDDRIRHYYIHAFIKLLTHILISIKRFVCRI